jgi:2-dehydropantoate 2-reductase
MRVCIVGAGAIGIHIGAMLGMASCEITVLARGETLDAIRRNGIGLVRNSGQVSVPARASDDPAELGRQDIVIISIKGSAVAQVAQYLAPLLRPDTKVITAMNGVPWWFFSGFGGQYRGLHLRSVDPHGALSANVPFESIIGSVIFPNCERIAPGVSRHNFGSRIVFGSPAGKAIGDIVALFRRAGFDASRSDDIHSDIWNKAVGNMVMNPVSALTGATCDAILDDPDLRAFVQSMMHEAVLIGERIGCANLMSSDRQIQFTQKMGKFKTSMLQDAEAGRPLEIDQLIAVVAEIGHAVGVTTRQIDALLAMVRVFGRAHGLYPTST